ncbi:MAG TPA: acetate--CoA ligase family protein [Burkholderiales bacterium]|nr:acetate--CoA ligase family protein [Burkholderiales bacterium]
MAKLDRLFSPRAIAVVGASEDPVRPGSNVVRALLDHGYRGGIFPVNPRYREHQGLRCYPELAAIDAEIDLVVIAIPAAGVNAVIADSVAKRVPYAVVLGGGFRESGPDGAALQDAMLARAAQTGLRIVGPNCLGLVNVHEKVYAAFGSMTRPPRLKPGPVSLVTQSGGFGYSVAISCAEAGLGFRLLVATGNEADLDTPELVHTLIDDPETRLVIAYVEGLRNGRALLDLGRRALAAGKPLLVWKAGITRAGARAAATHTANMTGSYDYYRGAFAQAGIVEIREVHEAADFAQALLTGKLPRGRRVAVLGGSGGSAIVFADAAEQSGLALAELAPATQDRLAGVIPAVGSVLNPVDFTAGYISSAGGEKFRAAVQAAIDDPGVDAACVNFATTGGAAALTGAQMLTGVARGTDKPLLAFLSTPSSAAAGAIAALAAGGIPTMPSPVRMATALAALARYHDFKQRAATQRKDLPQRERVGKLGPIGGQMSEPAAKAILAGVGIAVTRDVLVAHADEVPLEDMRTPVAVKIASPDIAHKTDIGAVRLNIRSRDELEAAVKEVLAAARKHAPRAAIEGVLVSEMVVGGYELIAGAVNDSVFGPVVVLGAGGIHAEATKDRTCRIAPFGPETAMEMVGELRYSAVLRGWRGRPPADIGALAEALARLSAFAWEYRAAVAEVDINPLIVTAQGAIAADALIVGQPEAPRK